MVQILGLEGPVAGQKEATVRTTYRVLAILVAVGVVLQAAFIAFAWFDVIAAIDGGQAFTAEDDGNAGHALHGFFGMTLIPLIALALLIVSFFAKIPGGIKWAGIVFGVTVLQVVLAIVAFSAPIVGALHGMNALLLAVVAGRAAAVAGAGQTTAPRVRSRSVA